MPACPVGFLGCWILLSITRCLSHSWLAGFHGDPHPQLPPCSEPFPALSRGYHRRPQSECLLLLFAYVSISLPVPTMALPCTQAHGSRSRGVLRLLPCMTLCMTLAWDWILGTSLHRTRLGVWPKLTSHWRGLWGKGERGSCGMGHAWCLPCTLRLEWQVFILSMAGVLSCSRTMIRTKVKWSRPAPLLVPSPSELPDSDASHHPHNSLAWQDGRLCFPPTSLPTHTSLDPRVLVGPPFPGWIPKLWRAVWPREKGGLWDSFALGPQVS